MTTNEDSANSADDFIGHSVEGKHLLLKVPDYEDTSRSSTLQRAKDTYLNLGRGTGDPDRPLPTWYATPGQPAVAAIPANPGARPPVAAQPAIAAVAQERLTGTAQKWSAGGLDPSEAVTASTSGDDLLAYFGGFVDDTRLRADGGTFEEPTATPPNEATARVASAAPFSAVGATAAASGGGRNLQVTETIPDYLGWRDHTDGHRITTTRGDKIEIIGGNYKIVSLGRGQGVAQYEMSGGIIVDGDEPPGGISSVTWRECPTGTELTAAELTARPAGSTATKQSGWKVVEQVVQGNVVERYHGTKREEFYGDKLISVTGSPDENTTSLDVGPGNSGEAETFIGETTGATRQNAALKAIDVVNTYAYPTKWDPDGGVPPKLQKPEIYESTWAKSVASYTHISGGCTEYLNVKGEHNVKAHYDDDYRGLTQLHGSGRKYIETWEMEGSMGFYEYFQGAMTQFFFGASTTMGLANRFEIFVGFEEQINVGGFFELKAGGQLALNVGGQMEVCAGPKLELETESLKFWLAKEDTGLSDLQGCLSFYKAALTDSQCGLSKTTIAAIQKL